MYVDVIPLQIYFIQMLLYRCTALWCTLREHSSDLQTRKKNLLSSFSFEQLTPNIAQTDPPLLVTGSRTGQVWLPSRYSRSMRTSSASSFQPPLPSPSQSPPPASQSLWIPESITEHKLRGVSTDKEPYIQRDASVRLWGHLPSVVGSSW